MIGAITHGESTAYELQKIIEKYRYNDAYSKQIDRENITRARGEKPPASQIRREMTRQYNETIRKLNTKSKVAKMRGKLLSPKANVAGQAIWVGVSYCKDRKNGASKTKRRSNLMVNMGIATLAVGTAFIPAAGPYLSKGISVAGALYADKIQKAANSLK